MKYYYYIDKEKCRQGPIALDDLTANEITPHTLVWCKGMEKWIKAKDVDDFSSILGGSELTVMGNGKARDDLMIEKDGMPELTSDVLVKCSQCGQMISDKAVNCPKCGRPIKKGELNLVPQEVSHEQPVYHEEDNGEKTRKWLYGLIAVLVAVILCGGYCWYNQSDEERGVKQFVEQFVAAIEANDTTSIRKMYPEAIHAYSLTLKENTRDFLVEKINEQWVVSLGPDQNMVVAYNNSDKSLYIIESHGIFVYPDSIMKIARRTGWFNPELNDVQNAKRLSDKSFVNWLEQSVVKKISDNVEIIENTTSFDYESPINYYIKGCDYIFTHTVVISNRNNFVIPSSDYHIAVIHKGEDGYDYYQQNKKRVGGKPIPANGSVTYVWTDTHFDGEWSYEDEAVLRYNPSIQKSLNSLTFTGVEYAEYMAAKSVK